jgi:NAD(P)-dependent dehydrogenase (short-subunit alcohol dehydrogenase family)
MCAAIFCNTLSPGFRDTDRNVGRRNSDPDEWADYVRTLNWMGRAGQPEEMLCAAIVLSSQACSFMPATIGPPICKASGAGKAERRSTWLAPTD